MFSGAIQKTTNPRDQVDLKIDFFRLANKYESDGTMDGGWFRCLLTELASVSRGKVLVQGISELALKWIASPDGINCLKPLNAEYLTFTIANPESDTSRGWHDKDFGDLFSKWSSARFCSLRDSPFDACTNIKTITIQLNGWYIYLKGYEQRPYPDQPYMIILPGSFENYNELIRQEKHWVQWRSSKYGIVYN